MEINRKRNTDSYKEKGNHDRKLRWIEKRQRETETEMKNERNGKSNRKMQKIDINIERNKEKRNSY